MVKTEPRTVSAKSADNLSTRTDSATIYHATPESSGADMDAKRLGKQVVGGLLTLVGCAFSLSVVRVLALSHIENLWTRGTRPDPMEHRWTRSAGRSLGIPRWIGFTNDESATGQTISIRAGKNNCRLVGTLLTGGVSLSSSSSRPCPYLETVKPNSGGFDQSDRDCSVASCRLSHLSGHSSGVHSTRISIGHPSAAISRIRSMKSSIICLAPLVEHAKTCLLRLLLCCRLYLDESESNRAR